MIGSEGITKSKDKIDSDLKTIYQKNYDNAWLCAINAIKVKQFLSIDDAVNTLTVLSGSDSPIPKILSLVDDNAKNLGIKPIDTKNINQALANLKQYMMTIQQSADTNKAGFDAAVLVMQNKQSPIEQLKKIAAKTPEPVKTWLNSVADNSWQVIVDCAHNEMNQAWLSQVIPVYSANIQGRYPLDVQAQTQITMDNFDYFFGNSGILANYFEQYIKPFINTTESPWKMYDVDKLSIELSESSLQLFERANMIRQTYFPNNAAQAQFSFSIKPLTLDNKAAAIVFMLGDKQLNYSHGPQESTFFTWPVSPSSQNSSIVLSDFEGEQYVHSAQGLWSIFKLFDSGSFVNTQNNGTYIFSVNLHNYQASYEITGNGDIGSFKLTGLKNFVIPTNIAGKING